MPEPVFIPFLAPVAEVTLLEDRAHVVRRGIGTLPQGRVQVVVRDVAPVLSDKTLTVAVTMGGDRARVVDARVRRSAVVLQQDEPADLQAITKEIEALDGVLKQQKIHKALLDDQLVHIEAIGRLAFTEMCEDTSFGRESTAEWRGNMTLLQQRERNLRRERVEIGFKIDETTEQRARLEKQRSNAQSPATLDKANLALELSVAVAGEVSLQIDYIVPGACWRPYHSAKIEHGAMLVFQSDGCVWQNTGEDWMGVQLHFSTQRPSLGTEPPPLNSDILVAQKKQPLVVVEKREQEIHTTGLGAGKAKEAAEVPGIDDGGEVLNLKAAHPANVPSDGRPYRVGIFAFQTEAQSEWVLQPELSSATVYRSLQTNRAPFPILAGPVDLIRDCGFVGRTSVLFIAPGEQFPLGWGPEGAIRAFRSHQQLDEEKSIVSNWSTREHRVTLHLSNLCAEARAVQVSERVPVSEVEKVQIVFDEKHTTEGKKPDANGFIKWTVALKPFGHEIILLHYTIKKHKDVVGL